jgi:hypothetical protein
MLILALLAASTPAQAPYEGHTLISPRTSNDSYLIDMDHNVIQTWHGANSVAQVAYMLPDGSLLRPCGAPNLQWGSGGAGGRIQKIDANDNVVWDYLFADSVRLQHHDIEPMPNGNVLVLAWERKSMAEAIAAGRQNVPFGEFWPTLIAEVEPVGATGGNILWEWHLWDHVIQDVDSTKDNYGVIADHPELVDINWANAQNGSWDHGNAIDYNPQLDQIVFCSRAMSEVYVIDHSTTTAEAAGHTGGNSGKGGDILYRWGNPQVYDRGTEGDRYFFSVHGATWIDPGMPGAGNLLIFNNGNRPGSSNDYSGVAEIRPPTDGRGNYLLASGQPYGPSTPTWVYEDPPTFYSQNKGGAYRMPNGNTLITESNDNDIFEVTAAGVKVWQYTPPSEVHRAKRYWDTPTGVAEITAPRARLEQSYPNPFNPTTTIPFTLRAHGHVELVIYDSAGRRIRTLISGVRSASLTHRAEWDGRDDNGRPVASGVYFYRLTTQGFAEARKLVLLK